MEIRHLKLIRAVAETKNLTKASQHLFLSQSALSHQLREIEDSYKTQVFVRARKQMILTPAGQRLLRTAQVVLNELEKTNCDLSKLLENDEGVLRVSTACYTCYHWLSPTMRSFRQKFPNVRLEVIPEATYSTIEFLLSGKLDLVLTSDKVKDANLLFRPLFEDELIAVVSPNHPWSSRKRILPQDFSQQTFLKYDIPEANSEIITEYFRPYGVMPPKIIHLQLTEAIIEMVKADMGVSVLAKWSVQHYLDRGELIGIPVAKMKKRTWYAMTLKNYREPRFLTEFVECLKSEIKL